MYIANCPFNKMKILSEATIGLEKSFQMMYSNIGLNSRDSPFKGIKGLSYEIYGGYCYLPINSFFQWQGCLALNFNIFKETLRRVSASLSNRKFYQCFISNFHFVEREKIRISKIAN